MFWDGDRWIDERTHEIAGSCLRLLARLAALVLGMVAGIVTIVAPNPWTAGMCASLLAIAALWSWKGGGVLEKERDGDGRRVSSTRSRRPPGRSTR